MTTQGGVATRTLRGVIYLGISSAATLVLGFGAGIVLARLLTPLDFGWFITATTIFVFLDLRTRFFVEQRYMQIADFAPAMLHSLLTVNVGLAVAAAAIAGVAAVIANTVGQTPIAICLLIISASGLIEAVTTSVRTHVEKQLAFRAFAVMTLAGQSSQFLVSIVLAMLGWGYLSLPVGLIAGSLVTLVGVLVVVRPSLALSRDVALMGDLLRYGRSHGVTFGVLSVILTYADNLIVAAASGTTALGYYDRAYRTASLPASFLIAIIQRVALPAYRSVETNQRQLARAAGMALWLLGAGSLPIATALFVTAPEFIHIVYGEPWLPAAPMLQALLLFTITRPMYDNAIALLVALKRSSTMNRLAFAQAVAVLGLGIPAAWYFGPAGVAVSTGIAFSLSAVSLYGIAQRDLRIPLQHVLVVPVAGAIISLVATWLAGPLIDQMPLLPRFVAKVGIVLAICSAATVIVSRNDVLERVQILRRSLRGSA